MCVCVCCVCYLVYIYIYSIYMPAYLQCILYLISGWEVCSLSNLIHFELWKFGCSTTVRIVIYRLFENAPQTQWCNSVKTWSAHTIGEHSGLGGKPVSEPVQPTDQFSFLVWLQALLHIWGHLKELKHLEIYLKFMHGWMTWHKIES